MLLGRVAEKKSEFQATVKINLDFMKK